MAPVEVGKAVWAVLFLTIAAAPLLAQAPAQGVADADPPGLVRTVAISADGGRALTGHAHGAVRVWDMRTKKLLSEIATNDESAGTVTPCYAFSADGKLALVGHSPGWKRLGPMAAESLALWDLDRRAKVRSWNLDKTLPAIVPGIGLARCLDHEPVICVALSRDGKRALSTSICQVISHEDMNRLPTRVYAVRLWDTTTGELIRTLVQENYFMPVAFSPDGKRCALGGCAYMAGQPAESKLVGWDVKVFDTNGGGELKCYRSVHTGCVSSLAFSTDGKSIAVGSFEAVRLWGEDTRKPRWSRDRLADGGIVLALEFSPDGQKLLVAGPCTDYLTGRPDEEETALLTLLNVQTGRDVPDFVNPKTWLRSAAFTPDGSGAVAGTVELLTHFRLDGKADSRFGRHECGPRQERVKGIVPRSAVREGYESLPCGRNIGGF